MSRITNLVLTLCVLSAMNLSVAQAQDKTTVINLMIDAYMPLSPSKEETSLNEDQLYNLYQEIKKMNLTGTIFSTQDFINTHARLPLTRIGVSSNFELAMSGNHSDEKLSSQSLSDQKAILKKSKDWVESCRICGKNEIIVKGFMPQSFDQNENTYEALDDLGIEYNTGFQAGIIFEPGHEDDVWPYKVDNHNFYAVPISSSEVSGEKMPVVDSYAKDKGLSSSQWYDLLVAKYEKAQRNDEPMVIVLKTQISGKGDYLEAIKKFLVYAKSKNARFVGTMELVNMSRSEIQGGSATTAESTAMTNMTSFNDGSAQENTLTECPACDAAKRKAENGSNTSTGIEIVGLNRS